MIWSTNINVFNPVPGHTILALSKLTLSQMANLRLFQTERICKQQLKFDENSGELSKWLENTEGKGEIAHYEQFLLFPQCF